MGNMVKADVTIQGVRPLFFHHFGPDALPLEKQEKTGVAGNDPQEWRRTCMVTRAGRLYILGTYVFSAMLGGAKYIKANRATLVNPVSATLQVLDDIILLNRSWPGFPCAVDFDAQGADPPTQDPEAECYLDVRGVVNPGTKGRNVRYRVATPIGWTCEFSLLFDKTIVDRNSMEAVLVSTGQLVGIGNGRKIGMGRFQVSSFECAEL